MAIWEYGAISRDSPFLIRSSACPFCGETLTLLTSDKSEEVLDHPQHYLIFQDELEVVVCGTCGWWKAMKVLRTHTFPPRGDGPSSLSGRLSTNYYGAAASLKELDLSDISTPLAEVMSYLTAKYESRFAIHPRILEETVASVFRDMGYDVLVTAYSGDSGIDVIMTQRSTHIGVQVKRYRDSIKAEQIRSLAGALVLNGLTRGIFVATSSFQKGAIKSADQYGQLGYDIDLIDGERFLEALKITQRAMYQSKGHFVKVHDLRTLPFIEQRP